MTENTPRTTWKDIVAVAAGCIVAFAAVAMRWEDKVDVAGMLAMIGGGFTVAFTPRMIAAAKAKLQR